MTINFCQLLQLLTMTESVKQFREIIPLCYKIGLIYAQRLKSDIDSSSGG